MTLIAEQKPRQVQALPLAVPQHLRMWLEWVLRKKLLMLAR